MNLTPPTQIREVMTKNPITVPYNHTIEETAKLMRIRGMRKEKTNLLYIVDHMDKTREMF